jgi:hypothetical protein
MTQQMPHFFKHIFLFVLVEKNQWIKFTEIARAKLIFKDFTYQMLLLNLIITNITAASSELTDNTIIVHLK